MMTGNAKKLKFTASVEWFQKFDMPTGDYGYYAVLSMNGNEIYRWKLSEMTTMYILGNDRNPSEGTAPDFDEDSLTEFVAAKISDVFDSVFTPQA